MSAPLARYADLAGRTVFISGGATGIGRDLVIAFHQQDAKVHFVDLNAKAGEALSAELSAKGAKTVFTACDVTDDDAYLATIDAAEADGGISVLVNNAANDTRMNIEDVDPDIWRKAVDVNLRHQFVAARRVLPLMASRGRGSVINFGSIAPEMKVPTLATYNMCKSAVRGLTRSLARDFGPKGVRVNSILPGAILTERQRELWFSERSAIDAVLDQQCIRRELCGEDVAAMALFLGSDVSAGCTAQDFIVDGGMI